MGHTLFTGTGIFLLYFLSKIRQNKRRSGIKLMAKSKKAVDKNCNWAAYFQKIFVIQEVFWVMFALVRITHCQFLLDNPQHLWKEQCLKIKKPLSFQTVSRRALKIDAKFWMVTWATKRTMCIICICSYVLLVLAMVHRRVSVDTEDHSPEVCILGTHGCAQLEFP